MIKYTVIKNMCSISYARRLEMTNTMPICFIDGKDIWFTVPINIKGKKSVVPHREDGPAKIYEYDGLYMIELYYWYGVLATDNEEFYDPNWRKKIEMDLFL